MRTRVFPALVTSYKQNIIFSRPENGHSKAVCRVLAFCLIVCPSYYNVNYVHASLSYTPALGVTVIHGNVVIFQIVLQDAGVFEMLTLAQELGVEDLQNSCEEHVTSTMSVLNACTFLAAAMDIQDRASSEYAT